MNQLATNRLITIAVSHYCEKARWALEWLKIPYIEESHVPIFHRLTTRRYGGKSVPVLITPAGVFKDSTEILHHLDATQTDRHLYPIDPTLRQEVEQLEELFDSKLGVHIRLWGYHYRGVSDREAMREMWCEDAPKLEKAGFELAFPLMSRIVRRVYEVSAVNAANSLQEIKQIFALVEARLTDDKRGYLVGDSFSAADLTFAALAAPILRPKNHRATKFLRRELAPQMAEVILGLRQTKAGKYGLRLYREHR
jgi:glutathione S-transferase